MKNFKGKSEILYLFIAMISLLVGCKDKREELNLKGECNVLALRLDTIDGIIDADSKTIYVPVDKNDDRSLMTVTRLDLSEGAQCNVTVGEQLNMRSVRTLRVWNQDAVLLWQVRAEKKREKVENPKALYVGLAEDYESLNIEEQVACQWMLDNIPESDYASFAQIAEGEINLSSCDVIWWHLHKDGSINSLPAFESYAEQALAAVPKLKAYYQRGGNLLLSRYATYLPSYLGEAAEFPDNCFGGEEAKAERVTSPWSFRSTGHTDHPIFANLVMEENESDRVYMIDPGYSVTNSTAQWYFDRNSTAADYERWRETTGAIDIARGGDDGCIVAWEFESNANHGRIICIGSGCFDWYSITSFEEHYHANVAIITGNIFNYLKGE